MAKKFKLYLLFALIGIVILGSFYLLTSGEGKKDAAKQLDAQGIALTSSSFIAEIQAGHKDNVHLLILTGANAQSVNDDGLSALQAAIAGSDPDIITMVLGTLPSDPTTAQAIINQKDADGKTFLISAVEKNNAPAVNQLIALGADASLVDASQQTPLIIAIKNNFDALIQPLIDADIKEHTTALAVSISDSSGKTPLMHATEKQNEKAVKLLLDARADGVSADAGGTTPLMIAAEVGNIPIAKMFIAKGAKTEVADTAGNTPLTIAILREHPDFVKFLIDSGADVDFHTSGPLPLQLAIDTEPFNYDVVSALMMHSKQASSADVSMLFKAIELKREDVVKTLLDRGISIKTTNAKGETLLYHAIESGEENIALMLIDKGADVNQTGVPGITPLERAAEHNESKVVQKLLAAGVSPNQKTAEGYTIAEMAVYRGYPETLEALMTKDAKIQKDFGILWAIRDGGGRSVPVLLAHGANPNIMNENGDSALWLAAGANETEALQALIDKHAAIDYPNKTQHMTPLAVAAHAGQLAAVKLLVDAGARLEVKDDFGMTPLAHAAYMTKPDVVEYLLSKGADIHATDSQGRSVIELAGIASASDARDKVMALLQKK